MDSPEKSELEMRLDLKRFIYRKGRGTIDRIAGLANVNRNTVRRAYDTEKPLDTSTIHRLQSAMETIVKEEQEPYLEGTKDAIPPSLNDSDLLREITTSAEREDVATIYAKRLITTASILLSPRIADEVKALELSKTIESIYESLKLLRIGQVAGHDSTQKEMIDHRNTPQNSR